MASTSAAACSAQRLYSQHQHGHIRGQAVPPHLNPNLSPMERQLQLNKFIAEKLSPFAAPQQFPGTRTSPSSLGHSGGSGGGGGAQAQAQGGQGYPSVFATQQPPTQGQLEYLQWLQQCQLLQWEYENRLKIPWYMWAIGIGDIVSAFGGLIYTAIDPPVYSWLKVLNYISEAIKFVMGATLLMGLTKKSAHKMLFFCNVWICFQFFFVFRSGLDFAVALLVHHESKLKPGIVSKMTVILAVFFVRLCSLWMTYQFSRKVKVHTTLIPPGTVQESYGIEEETGTGLRDQEQQHQQQQRQIQQQMSHQPQQGTSFEIRGGSQPGKRFATGEPSYAVASTSMAMSM